MRIKIRAVDGFRKAQINLSAFAAYLPRRAAKRRHTLQKPGRHGRGAIAFAGAAQNHPPVAHGLHEIMRCLAEFALRRREPQGGAHRAVEKSIGARLRRPHRFVEAAKQEDIGLDEACFEEPEDLQARMRLSSVSQDDFARNRCEKEIIGFNVKNHAIGRILRQFIEERVQGLARLAGAIVLAAGDGLNRCTMRRDPLVQCGMPAQIQKRRELSA